jgi:hypothetical protein
MIDADSKHYVVADFNRPRPSQNNPTLAAASASLPLCATAYSTLCCVMPIDRCALVFVCMHAVHPPARAPADVHAPAFSRRDDPHLLVRVA